MVDVLRLLLAAILIAAVASVIFVRFARHDPATWHVDPLTAEGTGKPNSFRVLPAGSDTADEETAPHYATTPAELAQDFDTYAMAQPRVERVAGAPDDLWVTYVQRSAALRFPDYITVRFVEVPGGASLAAFSRARFGHSDLGVNAARMAIWLAEFTTTEPTDTP